MFVCILVCLLAFILYKNERHSDRDHDQRCIVWLLLLFNVLFVYCLTVESFGTRKIFYECALVLCVPFNSQELNLFYIALSRSPFIEFGCLYSFDSVFTFAHTYARVRKYFHCISVILFSRVLLSHICVHVESVNCFVCYLVIILIY